MRRIARPGRGAGRAAWSSLRSCRSPTLGGSANAGGTTPVYGIAQSRIENRKLLDEYVGKALPTIQAHGGRVVAYDESPETVEGTLDRPRTVVLEFGSREAFRTWYDSPEYQAVLPLRLEAAPGTFIVVEGFAS